MVGEHALFKRDADLGMGQFFHHQRTAGFGPSFHLPGSPFWVPICLTHSHIPFFSLVRRHENPRRLGNGMSIEARPTALLGASRKAAQAAGWGENRVDG